MKGDGADGSTAGPVEKALVGDTLEAIFAKADGDSPLYLKLVADEAAAAHADGNSLLPMLKALPPRLPALFDRRLMELEKAPGGAEAAERVLTAVLVADGGLMLRSLLRRMPS